MNKKVLLSLLILFSCSFLLTGCGSNSDSNSTKSNGVLNLKKTMTCTKEEVDDDGLKTTDTMKITYNSKKVLKIKSTSISESEPEYIDMQLNFGNAFAEKFSELDGIDVKYEKTDNNEIKLTMNVDYNKINPEQIKEKLGDSYDETSGNIYSSTNYTIDKFKEENLDGYTCN